MISVDKNKKKGDNASQRMRSRAVVKAQLRNRDASRSAHAIKGTMAVQFLTNLVSNLDPISDNLDGVIEDLYKAASDNVFYKFTQESGIPESSMKPLKDNIADITKNLKAAADIMAAIQKNYQSQFESIQETPKDEEGA